MTEQEVKEMIDRAITQHNRNASIISMWLGAFCLAAFTDGILRMVGEIPPFMGIDVSIVQQVVEKIRDEVVTQI